VTTHSIGPNPQQSAPSETLLNPSFKREPPPERSFYQTPRPAPPLSDLTSKLPGWARLVIWERVLMALAVGLALVEERRIAAKRIRDYAAETARQVQWGSIHLYADPKMFETPEHTGESKRPCLYSDELIHLGQVLRQLERNAYRPLEGLIASIAIMYGLSIKTPSYVTLWRRAGKLPLPPLPKLKGKRVITVDSTGVKVIGLGEWRANKHCEQIERTYLKFHAIRDVKTGMIIEWALTSSSGEGSNDGQAGTWMVQRLVQEGLEIDYAAADMAYDSGSFRSSVWSGGGHAIVPPHHNAILTPEAIGSVKERNQQVMACSTEEGRAEWKVQSGYHMRSLAETTFSRHHARFGDRISSHLPERQRLDMAYRIWLLNDNALRSIA